MSLREPQESAWSRMSLAQQFALGSGVVMLLAALAVGYFVVERIQEAVVRNSATSTALYMESFIAPLTQDLARDGRLTPDPAASLQRLLDGTPLGRRVLSHKLWGKGAVVEASSDAGIVGQTLVVDGGSGIVA